MSKNLKRLLIYYGYLFLVWGSFRYFVRLPEVIEELWFKPVIWLTPLFWWHFSMREKLDLFVGRRIVAIGYGLLGGILYFGLLRWIAGVNPVISLDRVGIVIAVAVVEELTFTGVILSLLRRELVGEWKPLALTALMFALIHLPIIVFVYHLSFGVLVGAFCLAFFVCLVNGFLRLRSNNVLSPMLAHFVYLLMVLS